MVMNFAFFKNQISQNLIYGNSKKKQEFYQFKLNQFRAGFLYLRPSKEMFNNLVSNITNPVYGKDDQLFEMHFLNQYYIMNDLPLK